MWAASSSTGMAPVTTSEEHFTLEGMRRSCRLRGIAQGVTKSSVSAYPAPSDAQGCASSAAGARATAMMRSGCRRPEAPPLPGAERQRLGRAIEAYADGAPAPAPRRRSRREPPPQSTDPDRSTGRRGRRCPATTARWDRDATSPRPPGRAAAPPRAGAGLGPASFRAGLRGSPDPIGSLLELSHRGALWARSKPARNGPELGNLNELQRERPPGNDPGEEVGVRRPWHATIEASRAPRRHRPWGRPS